LAEPDPWRAGPSQRRSRPPVLGSAAPAGTAPRRGLLDNILWDLAALYPPGVEWKVALPPATFFNGPIVKRQPDLEAALARVGQALSPAN
jgi:hypothetical protein